MEYENTKTLNHNDLIKGGCIRTYAVVSTLAGYCAENDQDYKRMRGLHNHQTQPEAWSYQPGACIVAGSGAERYYAEERAKEEAAVEIEDGEIVAIEGRLYRIEMVGSRYSDPIKFIEVTADDPATGGVERTFLAIHTNRGEEDVEHVRWFDEFGANRLYYTARLGDWRGDMDITEVLFAPDGTVKEQRTWRTLYTD